MEDSGLARPAHSARMMIVHRPAAVCHQIIESALGPHIILSYYMIPNVAAAFPLSGQESHPFQCPVFRSVIAMILDVIPDSKSYLEKLIPQYFRIMNGIILAAKLNPPEV